MDYNQTLTLLRLNGVSEDASPEELSAFLVKARYTEADIARFIEDHKAKKNGQPLPQRMRMPASAYPSPVTRAAEIAAASKPKSRPVLRIVALVVVVIALAACAYTAYAVYGVSPEKALIGGAGASAKDTKFHVDFDLHTVATSTSNQLKFTVSADVDTTNPDEVKIDATPAIDMALFSGNVELRVIGKSLYAKINEISLFGQAIPPQNAWYEAPLDQLKDGALPVSVPDDAQSLLGEGSTTPAERAQKLFDDGVITAVGSPRISAIDGKPVLIYTFKIDGDKLAAQQRKEAGDTNTKTTPQDVVHYGPMTVTKDLITGRLASIDGTASMSSTSIFGAKKTTSYVFRLTYRAAPNISITKPENPQPIAALKDALQKSVEEGLMGASSSK